MARRSDIDWEKVQQLYTAGQLTIREIARQCGINPSSVTEKAKSEGWKRNLSGAIKQLAKAKIAQIDVDDIVQKSIHESAQQSAQTIQKAIDEAANAQAGVVFRHRRYIREDFERACRIESALDDAISSGNLEFGDIVRATQAYKALVDAKSKLIEKERQACCIDDEPRNDSDDGQTEIVVNLVSGSNGED